MHLRHKSGIRTGKGLIGIVCDREKRTAKDCSGYGRNCREAKTCWPAKKVNV